MDRAKFFAALRRANSGVFGSSLSQQQVNGIEAILDSAIRNNMTDAHHVANVLAQVRRETGGRMAPVREAFASSDQQAINALERAWKAGRLKWVRTPYWRPDANGLSWFGRGQIQITHKSNFAKMGERLRVNLTGDPSLALDPKISADIAVVGMAEGLFTGRKLSDFNFPAALDAPVSSNPRRIVNGQDGSDREVAIAHRAFHKALIEAGWTEKPTQTPIKPDPRPQTTKPMPTPETPPAVPQGGFLAILVAFIKRLFGGK